jgi:amino acid transporter
MNAEQVLQIGPSWQEMLIMSIVGAFLVVFGGMVAGRAGRAPFWSLLLLLPYAQILALVIFAFISWPRIDKKKDGK